MYTVAFSLFIIKHRIHEAIVSFLVQTACRQQRSKLKLEAIAIKNDLKKNVYTNQLKVA